MQIQNNYSPNFQGKYIVKGGLKAVNKFSELIYDNHFIDNHNYINLKPIVDGDNVIVPLIDRLLGRTIAEDIYDTDGKTVLVSANTTMSREDIEKISHLTLNELKVRSGLTCSLEYGVCQKIVCSKKRQSISE